MRITRREFCQSTATVALSLAVVGVSALPSLDGMALAADTVSDLELMKPDKLPDMVMGNDKASVTVIEYASMTCPHCAHFQETTFPELKKRYIDTGKIRYIFREFPLDTLAAAASMLARCSSGDTDSAKYFALTDTLFRQQRTWAVEKPLAPLLAIAKQAGFNPADFRRLSGESEGARRYRKHPPARCHGVQSRVDPDFLHQRHQVRGRAGNRRNGQADRRPSEGLIRVFALGRAALPPLLPLFCRRFPRKVWKTSAGTRMAVAQAGATIHCPGDASPLPSEGPSPGSDCNLFNVTLARLSARHARFRKPGMRFSETPSSASVVRGLKYETHAAPSARFQVVRRTDRFPDRAGSDRRGRSERLRQIEPGRSAALGDGRILVQVDARVVDGGRDFLRVEFPAGAQQRRSRDLDRQFRALGAIRLQRPGFDRNRPPHRARGRLRLSHQRPRSTRPRRADGICRRLDRRPVAGLGASGPHRRDHPG